MSNGPKTKGTAQVEVLVNVHLEQPWDDMATLGDLYRAASREAREHVERALGGCGNVISTRVKGVIMEQDK